MVTVLLSGGLGNQMFQYAAAKALAVRLNVPLYLDTYTLTKKSQATARSFELDIFNLNACFSSSLKSKFLFKIRPFVQKHHSFFTRWGFFTDTYAILYQPAFESLKGNITLSGYFQNEKYFEGIKEIIRKDFSFKAALSNKNEDVAHSILEADSVSIHIRRGDYTTNPNAVSNFVTCDKDYYLRAINHITQKVKDPIFYIFSDEPEWVRNNLDFGNHKVEYIDWNKGRDSYIDMQLMSLCKHNIIANSSFSWWGAWLNKNVDKIVVAPSLWFRDKYKNSLLDDFFPEGWWGSKKQ